MSDLMNRSPADIERRDERSARRIPLGLVAAGLGAVVVGLAVFLFVSWRGRSSDKTFWHYYDIEKTELLRGLRAADTDGRRALALERLGGLYRKSGELRKARSHYEEALELYERLGLEEAAGACLRGLGNVHFVAGRLDRAEENHRKALEIATRLEQPVAISLGHCGLGNVALARGDHDEAMRHYRVALEFEEPFVDYLWMSRSVTYSREREAAMRKRDEEIWRKERRDIGPNFPPTPSPTPIPAWHANATQEEIFDYYTTCGTGADRMKPLPSLRECRLAESFAARRTILEIDEEPVWGDSQRRFTSLRLHWNLAVLYEMRGDRQAADREWWHVYEGASLGDDGMEPLSRGAGAR